MCSTSVDPRRGRVTGLSAAGGGAGIGVGSGAGLAAGLAGVSNRVNRSRRLNVMR
jgi:hypothetical protein